MACEINSGDELVATEMIFAGVLSELEPEEAVALLSALVFQVGFCDHSPTQDLQRSWPPLQKEQLADHIRSNITTSLKAVSIHQSFVCPEQDTRCRSRTKVQLLLSSCMPTACC